MMNIHYYTTVCHEDEDKDKDENKDDEDEIRGIVPQFLSIANISDNKEDVCVGRGGGVNIFKLPHVIIRVRPFLTARDNSHNFPHADLNTFENIAADIPNDAFIHLAESS